MLCRHLCVHTKDVARGKCNFDIVTRKKFVYKSMAPLTAMPVSPSVIYVLRNIMDVRTREANCS